MPKSAGWRPLVRSLNNPGQRFALDERSPGPPERFAKTARASFLWPPRPRPTRIRFTFDPPPRTSPFPRRRIHVKPADTKRKETEKAPSRVSCCFAHAVVVVPTEARDDAQVLLPLDSLDSFRCGRGPAAPRIGGRRWLVQIPLCSSSRVSSHSRRIRASKPRPIVSPRCTGTTTPRPSVCRKKW
jgi:hypothetical protein